MITYFFEYSYSHTPKVKHVASFDSAFMRGLEAIALVALGVTIHRSWEE